MSLPTAIILSMEAQYTKNGALYDPSPAPTVTDASYPDGTVLATGLPITMTHVRTGVYTANVFTALQSTLVGTYQATANTSDATVDQVSGNFPWAWIDVGINNVTAGSIATVTGNVGGNVTGSVGSVLGNVAGSVASVVGNVGGSVGSVVATVAANLTQILTTPLTESVAGYLAAAFKKFFNVVTPTSTMNEITLVDTTTNLTNAAPDSSTVTEIGADVDELITTIGVAGVGLTNLGDTRIANLDATISSRLAASAYTAPDNADIATIVAKTNQLTFTVPNHVDATASGGGGGITTGFSGAAATQINDIQTQVDKIGTGTITVVALFGPDGTPIGPFVVGDTFTAAIGRSFDFTITGLPFALSGTVVYSVIIDGITVLDSISGIIRSSNQVRFEMTSTQSAKLSPAYATFVAVVTLTGGEIVTLELLTMKWIAP